MFICFELGSKCLKECETLFLQLLSVVFMLEIYFHNVIYLGTPAASYICSLYAFVSF